jgi:protein transport protein YIF1
MPDSSPNGGSSSSYTANRTQKSRRTYFLFIYSYVIQLALMWFLSMPERTVVAKVGGRNGIKV